MDENGQDGPYTTGTVRYAVECHRTRGRYPNGRPMPSPRLVADGLAIDWDRLDLPLVNRIEEPTPCLSPSGPRHRRHASLTLRRLDQKSKHRVTLYQVLDQLQDLLSCWTGVCCTCQRPLPPGKSTNRTRQPAPT
ncbi:hypothetical protein AB0A71_04870 [Kitasatospora aureofaciens]|uniref:hypothetical protein n=1 Tax=Kitasatospora aureofaciens TaxID=1894 RepID=UPI0033D3B4D5